LVQVGAWVAFALSALTTSWLRIALLAHALFIAGIVIALHFVLARAVIA